MFINILFCFKRIGLLFIDRVFAYKQKPAFYFSLYLSCTQNIWRAISEDLVRSLESDQKWSFWSQKSDSSSCFLWFNQRVTRLTFETVGGSVKLQNDTIRFLCVFCSKNFNSYTKYLLNIDVNKIYEYCYKNGPNPKRKLLQS